MSLPDPAERTPAVPVFDSTSDGTRPDWWREAVTYQVYVRSFADGDGDGIGDLPGITSRLPYLRDLGVDAVWLTPFYTSPQKDHGYDVADYTDVDPLFGRLTDADALVAEAHRLGLRVIVDLVPNHTSSAHPWFRAALAAAPGSPERARYLFRDGRGPHGAEPPNNWRSVFGGPAWTRVDEPDGTPQGGSVAAEGDVAAGGSVAAEPTGARSGEHDSVAAEPTRSPQRTAQWFLHLFDSSQPDLDWRNPEVEAMFEGVLRFWLDRGVDGFRIDVAHGLVKEASLRDQIVSEAESPGEAPSPAQNDEPHAMVERTAKDEPMWDQPEVHDIYRSWRRLLDSYSTDGHDRMLVAEAWTQTPESLARYVRPDEMQQAFNFAWLLADWSAKEFEEVVRGTLEALAPVGASPTWVLSNHDVVRHPTRYGGGRVGLDRARAATLAMLGLPGSAYLYQGEELGLEQVDVPDHAREDPAWLRTRHTQTPDPGRDGCRVPLPWSGTTPPYGFSAVAGQPWLPQPAAWAALTVEAQTGAPASTLEFYRRALAARRTHALSAGDEVELLDLGEDLFAFRRGPLTVVLNAGEETTRLPARDVLIASGELEAGALPPNTCVWLG
ncbi:glycoside hydrolase family 13 protein [Nocardioides sp. DS6]|uniref:Glycoside hydrolase family 13 protein n=1 Tax=Nocardioides eburneus TaxID=3231482 RepID=A0ABV3SYN7_9ACTN